MTANHSSVFQVFRRRQQTQVVWDQYLSSVEKIVLTALTIIQVS